MIETLNLAPASEVHSAAGALVPGSFSPPPTMGLLPRRRARTRQITASTVLHGITIAAWLWLPPLFPSAVILDRQVTQREAEAQAEPLVLPDLPQIKDSGSGQMRAEAAPAKAGSGPVRRVELPLPVPDYTKPQAIVSFVPNPVNRIQTILRPDLVKAPKLKFPLRLQSMVVLPATAQPVLAAREEPKPAPAPVAAQVEVPVVKAPVPAVVTLNPQHASVIRAEQAPAKAVAPNFKATAGSQMKALKSIVVVNAVNVVADNSATAPDAELAGLFVVGPATGTSAMENASPTGTGTAPNEGPANSTGGSASESSESGTATGSGSGRSPIPGSGSRSDAAAGTGLGKSNGNGPAAGTGTTGAGGGSGTGPSPGAGSGSGTTGHGSGSGPSTGISISGGVPGRGNATVAKAIPQPHSYGMMIISGGSSGGASRDLGVFGRNETVYSVAIPMNGVGGSSDWTMQYSLLNPVLGGAGLLVPPFVQKKTAATVPKSQMTDPTPVFIVGTIDESGKLQGLRAARTPDGRSLAAIMALRQWEFLPAQLNGKPVSCKVLIGVTLSLAE